ncbi:ABC transporter ATP-binding protein [Oricola sp.]|uniref:ABC transporter ATP-binding protein n=1 Tax=Oricola sp. TaxID=1979950 RepID=UPI003BA9DF1A
MINRAGASGASVRLGADRLSKRYGNVLANQDVSLTVAPGEIHAIVGENGAGKSTLMRMLQGIEKPDNGHVVVDDKPYVLSGPQQAFSLGIGMVHQEFMLAPDLTLLENLILGEEPFQLTAGPLSRIDWDDARRSGSALAEQAAIEIDWNRRAASAPVHVRQFVEIIRLLRRGTRILILDEPTAVLAPRHIEDLFSLLRTLRDQGTTILFISHKLREVMALADRVTVMRRGRVVFSSPISETSIDDIASHMVGGEDLPVDRERERAMMPPDDGDAVLRVRGLSIAAIERSHPLHDVDLHVASGEIVGIAGVSGNGQHELTECLVGLRDASAGSIHLADHDVTILGNRERRGFGMGYISADRRSEGLALDASIEANVIVGSHREPPICKGGLIDRRAMRRVSGERLAALDVRFGGFDNPVSSLSGGNQQKLVFAREVSTDPKLLVVSQPTRGVDLVGIAAIHEILRDFRDKGGAVLLISEELDEIISLSDRIYVMAGGRIVGERQAADATIADIGGLMLAQVAGHG